MPEAARNLSAQALPAEIALAWEGPQIPGLSYNVYRAPAGSSDFAKLNAEPLPVPSYSDLDVAPGTTYAYVVRSLDRRNQQSSPSEPVEASPLPEIKEPVFVADFSDGAQARRLDGSVLPGQLQAGAKTADGALELGSTGWFLQRYGGGWRWHLAPVSCDGGRPVVGRWVHLVGTFDGKNACLYEDGKLAAQVACYPTRAAWSGPLVVGQYSSQSPVYQVQGGITRLKLYHRALRAAEVAEKFQAGQEAP
ncbi:MAG: hypothetical protein A2V98_19220 [Planctomycetes bacterium RBG_16_64_12]|nr:MAG: hypothetical protein A2V98_19220 [Planctomycetes bacterium RBG_16_64_12]